MEEQDHGEEMSAGGIREYLVSYKLFSENITSALKGVVSEEADRSTMESARAVLENLMQLIPRYSQSQIYSPKCTSCRNNTNLS
jgi:PI-3-kinase-related kinase SMG-1